MIWSYDKLCYNMVTRHDKFWKIAGNSQNENRVSKRRVKIIEDYFRDLKKKKNLM